VETGHLEDLSSNERIILRMILRITVCKVVSAGSGYRPTKV
jgi:hypothetical protein